MDKKIKKDTPKPENSQERKDFTENEIKAINGLVDFWEGLCGGNLQEYKIPMKSNINMTEEEKKAIEFIKRELEDEKRQRNDYQSLTGLYGNLEIEIMLTLIEKQQKEIELLKENKGYHLGFIDGGIAKKYEYQDIIKEKIEEIKNTGIDVAWEQINFSIKEQDRAKIQVLQELLEE